MGYVAGVDLGTTYSAAAVLDSNGLRAVDLSTHSTVMPSVVAVRSGGEVLTGTNAERRLVSQPSTVAREFKRRLGDATPVLLGGTPYATADLTGYLLASIIDVISERQDEPPELVGLSHPANYGEFKLDLLASAARTAGLAAPVFVAEPVAAAVHYSLTERVAAGDVIAVYDLGGGTFDASVVRRTADSFELIGTPDGMDRFGGIDLDEAVLGHVRRSLAGDLEELDRSDPAVNAALTRLRDDCREAKEALSGDAEVEIPVMLPGLHTEVRLTRPEFEAMIRPRVSETIDVLRRTVRSAEVEVEDLSRVLLVGGSSRIPLIGEMITQELGKPIGLDAHPKLTVALGTARVAGGDTGTAPTVEETSSLPPIVGSRDTAELAGIAALATPEGDPTVPIPAGPTDELAASPPPVADPTAPLPVSPPPSSPNAPAARRPGWVVPAAIGAVALVLAAVGGFLLFSPNDGDESTEPSVVTDAAGQIDVPSVTGREAVAARDTLAAAGLTVDVDEVQVASDSPDDGFVIAQSIPAGTAVDPGTQISITVGRVSAAPSTVATEPSATPTSAATTTSTATTTTATTTTATTTTATTTLPLTAEQQLALVIDEDAPLVAGIAETWLPQLSAKRLGLEIDGVVFGYEEILADHMAHRAAYDAVLIDGGTYNFNLDGDQMTGWYMTLVPQPFGTFEGALDWCRLEDIGRDDCFAKFLSADPENIDRTIRLQ